MKKKLLYINNFEAPYRVPFFNLLGEEYDMTLALSQRPEERTERNEKWFSEHERNYRIIYLNKITIFGKKIGLEIRHMLKEYDMVFMDMYGNPTNMYAIYCLNRMKKPFVMSVDGMLPREKEGFLNYTIKKYLLNSPTLILSPGKSVDGCIMHYGVPKEKIKRYHFTSLTQKDIDEAKIPCNRYSIREKLKIHEQIVILSVGQFVKRKGFDILLNAAKTIGSDAGFYFVGGEATEELRNIVKQNDMNWVHFVEFKTKKELAEYYRAADIFCLPTREDIWGLVINEAMSYGLPVITTERCVAGLELVENGVSGFIVPTDNSEILIEKISLLINNLQLVRSMSNRCFERIKGWSVEKMAEKHIEVLNRFDMK